MLSKTKFHNHLLLSLLFLSILSIGQTIKMDKSGGVYTIPCKVNDLALKFIFDTGASNVSISLSEALFMLKNGYLSEGDLGGSEYYRIANGEIAEGTKVVLRKIEIGEKTLFNIEASIVHSLEAPLLLGQSVMERLGQFTIDYATNSLIIGKQIAPKQTVSNTSESGIPSVKIGDQIWMRENLNVEKFRNGEVIPKIQNNEEWAKGIKNKNSAWCYYENDPNNGFKYGKLYNWSTVVDPRGLCPTGWHIPSIEDWMRLANYYENIAEKENGNKLIGFDVYPGGCRKSDGTFESIGTYGFWWSSTEDTPQSSWYNVVDYRYDSIKNQSNSKRSGFSVRCIRD